MKSVKNLLQKLEGKIVVGSSAGALCLMNHYYENDTDTYHCGLGIIEAKCICHWKDQYKQLSHLKSLGNPNDEMLLIPEGAYVYKEV